VSIRSTAASLGTLDGLHLAATIVTPDEAGDRAIVLVHGGGVTREEGGFFTRLAAGLGEAGVASLRFDFRGHGKSEGRQEELTLAAILNDIRVAGTRSGSDRRDTDQSAWSKLQRWRLRLLRRQTP
jgi:hypothetical protein